jgi:hypothetical protein
MAASPNPPPWFETARWCAPPHHEAESEIAVAAQPGLFLGQEAT